MENENKIKVSIVGASGYAGGELLRLLLGHPNTEIMQVTSERFAGKFVFKAHPNLRKNTDLKFSSLSELRECDVLFTCLPSKKCTEKIDEFKKLSKKIIDLSSDFRLNDVGEYEKYYGSHSKPELLKEFVYGIPELHRSEIEKSDFIAKAGCNATATILALYPLYKKGLVEKSVVEVKVGSSEAGNKPSLSSHHPERSGSLRSFKPTNHRQIAEMSQELGARVDFSATSVEMVRGILATCHVFLNQDLSEKDIWKIYREFYGEEKFIRIVKDNEGIYRFPEPKILAGTNYCDIGFERDPNSNRLVVISALDNLMKGSAGQAIQCFNIMHNFPEDTGLKFPGLHPI